VLLLYRRAAAFRGETRLGARTFLLAAGYFFVWVQFGVLSYLIGEAVTRAAVASVAVSQLVPLAAGVALVLAGIFQLSPLKSACLRHCRDPLSVVAHHLHGGWRGALALGIHHGALCAACCWALMLIQLVLGVMNLAVMVAVAMVIALEKLISRGELVARIAGVASILGGIILAASSIMGWHLLI
jgi:predicted metal-binding membrane protein